MNTVSPDLNSPMELSSKVLNLDQGSMAQTKARAVEMASTSLGLMTIRVEPTPNLKK